MTVRTSVLLLRLLLAATAVLSVSGLSGRFLHLTDIHWDPDYVEGGDPDHYCWASSRLRGDLAPGSGAGPFGNDWCDAPKRLVDESLAFAHSVEPNPDFILWTGDDPPHLKEADLSQEKVATTVRYMTEQVHKLWPNTRVIPCIGNHDYYPAHQLPARKNWMFDLMGELWADWMQPEEQSTWDNYGYFATWAVHPGSGSRGLKVLSVNTVYYYHLNRAAMFEADPGKQFAWMRQQLADARDHGYAVWLISHLPPGFDGDHGNPCLWGKFNKVYVDVITEFADVVTNQFYGHLHTDEFRIYMDGDKPVSFGFLAGSITPWKTRKYTDPISPNPAVRVFKYDTSTFQVLDYDQYYADIDQGNASGQLSWKLLYSAVDAFGLPSPLTPQGYLDLYDRMKKDDALAQKYWRYYRLNKMHDKSATAHQILKVVCATRYVDIDEYEDHCKH